MKWTSIGIVFCLTFGLFPGMANADKPEKLKKEELAARITEIEEAIREQHVLPVLPPPQAFGPGVNCLVATAVLCTHPDGTITAYCPPLTSCSDSDPSPFQCPEVCEEQGGVVVVDYAQDACDALAAGKPFAFVCMNPEEYAERPSCPDHFVLHYRSSTENKWVCEPPVGNVHISRSVFDALLFERARTGYIKEDLEDQINEIKKCVDCSGLLDPVIVDNKTYINSCWKDCASSDGQ